MLAHRIGEDRHVMTYCIAGGTSFNMVLSHPDKGDPALFGSEEDMLADMRAEFQGWDSQYVSALHPSLPSFHISPPTPPPPGICF